MKRIIIISLAIVIAGLSKAQIVTDISSLPESGDILSYKALEGITSDYLTSGEDVTWDFTGMTGSVITEEVYLEASEGTNFDQFPSTDILITLAGAEAYANRNTTNIEVVGIAGGQLLEGLELAEAQLFSEPYVIRRAPLGFEDSYSSSTSFGFSVATEDFGPLADVIDELNPIEGATVDSIRLSFNLSRVEEVDSYGTVLLGSESVDALRLVQNDVTEVGVEIYVVTGILDSWFNVSDFIDLSTLGFENLTTTNYVFLDETSKEYLLEVNVNGTTLEETGRYNSDFTNSVVDQSPLLISVFPNPASDVLIINGERIQSVELLNEIGQVVKRVGFSGNNQVELNISELPRGIYSLRTILNSSEVLTSKVVKQ